MQKRIITSLQETVHKDKKPSVIKWKGVKMLRKHSFMASVREIGTFASVQDLTRIGLIGDPGAGKSTMAMTLAHVLHQVMEQDHKLPFAVKVLHEKELMSLEETLAGLEPVNHILIFDDVSFLDGSSAGGRKNIEKTKNAVTKIRHLEGGQDVRMILIMNYHYSKGLDKYLRQADFKYYLTVGSEEKENMAKILGTKRLRLIQEMITARHDGIINGKWKSVYSKRRSLYYDHRKPFIPALFINSVGPRMVVSPRRQWIDPVCNICSEAEDGNVKTSIDLGVLIEECKEKFGPQPFMAGVRLMLAVKGISTYSPSIMAARKYMERVITEHNVSLEQLALACGLKVNRARLLTAIAESIDSKIAPDDKDLV